MMEKLRALHEVDKQLRGLRGRIESSQRRLRMQQEKLNKLEQEKQALEQHRQQVKARIANMEAEIKALDEKISSLREKMNLAKTNKEYTAFLTEVNTHKADRGRIEEDALKEMTAVEEMNEKISALDEQISERNRLKTAAENELNQRQQDAAERLAELEKERKVKAAEVPGEALAEYERLCRQFDGDAMAAIVEDNRKRMEYSCGSCYMSVTAETFNALMVGEKLVTCTSCGVILYVEPELAESMKK